MEVNTFIGFELGTFSSTLNRNFIVNPLDAGKSRATYQHGLR